MRWAFLGLALWLTVGCSSISTYDPTAPDAPRSSYLGNRDAGQGVQTSIWSDDPSKKTIVNPGSPSQ